MSATMRRYDNALSRGIRPESLPPEEDVKKLERRLASETRKTLTNPEALDAGEAISDN